MKKITELIPHRDPFLFIDDILEFNNEIIKTTYLFSSQRDVFQGHFPENPIVPGVLISEACLQSGAAFMGLTSESTDTNKTPVVSRIAQAKFKNILRPDERFIIETKLKEVLSGAYFFSSKVKREDTIILKIEFACNLL